MTKEEFVKNHLNYYLLLENEFKTTFQFVTIEKENYNTYSDEYLKLILSLGSEIYVIKDILANLFDSNFDPKNNKNSNKSFEIIEKNVKDIKFIEVKFKENNESIKPFDSNGYPKWKIIYNKIKHERTNNTIFEIDDPITGNKINDPRFDVNKKWYQYGNLECLIYMFSVLHTFEMITYKKLIEDDNAKNHKKESIVPIIKTLFRITNLDWGNEVYSDGVRITDGAFEFSN